MATPLSADRLLRALRNEGLRVVEYRDWRTHNRNHKGPFGPVHGVMIHHTVTSGTASSVELCYNGHSTLPGPLYHIVVAKNGTIYLVGYGRANHAGLGDDDVLDAVIDERDLPADNEANTDGNRHYYGLVGINLGDGKDPWPVAQLEAIERAAVAICRAHGWNEESVLGHLEWQPGKVDPRGFSMAAMRSRIQNSLAGSVPSTPAPNPSEEDDVTEEQMNRIADKVVDRILSKDAFDAPRDAADYTDDPKDHRHYWSGRTVFRDLVTRVRNIDNRTATTETTGLTETQIDALADRLLDKMSGRLTD